MVESSRTGEQIRFEVRTPGILVMHGTRQATHRLYLRKGLHFDSHRLVLDLDEVR